MKKQPGWRSTVAVGVGLTALLGLATPQALPQAPPPPSHVPIPSVPGEALPKASDKMIQMYLKRPGLPDAQRVLLERARDNPTGLERRALDTLLGDPALLREFRDNPELVRRALEAQRDAKKADSPDVQRLMEDIKKRQEAAAEKPSATSQSGKPMDVGQNPSPDPERPQRPAGGPSAPQAGSVDGPEEPSPDANPEAAAEEPPAGWKDKMVHVLERLRDPDGPLAHSPALREAMQDLSVAALDSFDPESADKLNGVDLDRQVSRWGRTWRQLKQLTSPAREAAHGMGLPSWSGVRSPRLSRGLSHIPTFGVGRLAGASSTSLGVGAALAWLVVMGALAGVLWQVVIRYQRIAALDEGPVWRLGPWPVAPGAVATREDLVRAFDYLVLLRLGQAAQAWNHREVAIHLGGEDARRRNAAAELADLYERARYAPLYEGLGDEALSAARRDLCLLAGVATA